MLLPNCAVLWYNLFQIYLHCTEERKLSMVCCCTDQQQSNGFYKSKPTILVQNKL